MSTSTDLTLAIEDLTVSFDGFKAVDNLNLYIDKNELHVVIGPNGCLLYTSPSPRDRSLSRMPSSA